jgi:hypothetical protein
MSANAEESAVASEELSSRTTEMQSAVKIQQEMTGARVFIDEKPAAGQPVSNKFFTKQLSRKETDKNIDG